MLSHSPISDRVSVNRMLFVEPTGVLSKSFRRVIEDGSVYSLQPLGRQPRIREVATSVKAANLPSLFFAGDGSFSSIRTLSVHAELSKPIMLVDENRIASIQPPASTSDVEDIGGGIS